MREPFSKNSLKMTAILLGVGLLVAAITIGTYVSIFGPLSGYSFARSDGAWSNFGNYLGGVLGSLFSFLAFVGVLLTVWLQAKQLDTSRTQANLDEIQRVLSNLSTNIDALLAQPPSKHINHYWLRDAPITVFTIVAAAGSAALSSPSDYIVKASHEQLIAAAKDAVSTEATAIGLELEQLTWCLQEYQRQNGAFTVVEFYKRRYNAITCWLDAIGMLGAHHRVHEYFKPKEVRELLQ